MVGFVAKEDAKPMVPHKLGLPCLGCGAQEASWWRGPGSRYCQCCKKEAGEARAALKADPKDKVISELTERLTTAEQGLASALSLISKLTKRVDEHDEELDGHEKDLDEASDAMKALRKQLSQVPQQQLMAQPTGKPATAKRPALRLLSDAHGRGRGTALACRRTTAHIVGLSPCMDNCPVSVRSIVPARPRERGHCPNSVRSIVPARARERSRGH